VFSFADPKKCVFIAGGSKGLGKELALELARKGLSTIPHFWEICS
jgi:NAD(P)-dependent dehydrogenase (short-subunit alcohol dehydrogenase family)